MINLELSRQLFNDAFYPLLTDNSTRWQIYMGSAGSGKSFFITQKLILRALNEQIRILVCRRYGTTIRQTVFSLFKDILTQWKILPYVKVNESDYRIKFPNGSEVIFMGLDEETKLLSLNDISVVWVEEAYEVSKDIVEQLNLRMRGKADNQQIIMSFNPISKHSWLYDFCNNPPESYVFHHSTYKDNIKFLSEEYIQSLEELRERNPQKSRIYCDGEWGVDTDGLVFSNWLVDEVNPLKYSNLEHRVGSDLGFIDPTTIVCSLYDRANKTIYVYDEFYKRGCQLDEVYNAMLDMKLTKTPIWMDSAEPRTIDYFKRQGIYAKPCIKGQNSVEARITFLQNHKIVIDPHCENLITELENFSYEKDKRTGQYSEKMTHEWSHAIDGLGYAYSDIYTRGKLKTVQKSVLGL